MIGAISRGEAADNLREQASTCRRLAARAMTRQGSQALAAVANYFESDARRIDPHSERR
jgi:hypothetical protein